MELQIIKLHEDAKLPSISTDYSAGYDLYTYEEHELPPRTKSVIPLGIALRMPPPQNGLKIFGSMRSRSSLSAKYSLEVGAGVVDRDYTGELKVVLYNHSDEWFRVEKHDRIAQLILQTYIDPPVVEVEEFGRLKRPKVQESGEAGEVRKERQGGFGSTGR